MENIIQKVPENRCSLEAGFYAWVRSKSEREVVKPRTAHRFNHNNALYILHKSTCIAWTASSLPCEEEARDAKGEGGRKRLEPRNEGDSHRTLGGRAFCSTEIAGPNQHSATRYLITFEIEETRQVKGEGWNGRGTRRDGMG